MTRYQKGASAERELLNVLYEKGYAVIRAAGSESMRLARTSSY